MLCQPLLSRVSLTTTLLLAYEGKIIRFYHEDEAIAFLTFLGLDDGSYYVDYYAKTQNREFINCVELAGRCYRSSMQ